MLLRTRHLQFCKILQADGTERKVIKKEDDSLKMILVFSWLVLSVACFPVVAITSSQTSKKKRHKDMLAVGRRKIVDWTGSEPIQHNEETEKT